MQKALMLIKPFTVSRDEAGDVLSDTLEHSTLLLTRFRQWVICPNTLKALCSDNEVTLYPFVIKRPCWICLFTSYATDPFNALYSLWGPEGSLRNKWRNGLHPSDTVVRLTDVSRVQLEEDLLF